MGINDMLADMLKKAIPAEVAALLTEEKIKGFGVQAKTFIEDLRAGLARIEADQKVILMKLEGIENDNGSDSKRTVKSKPSARGSGSGSADK